MHYVYDGIQAIGELRDGVLAATVITGLNIDEVIARTVNVSGGQNPVATKSYLTDALGSVLAMTRQDQNPELFYSYSAYGETQPLGADPDSPASSNQYTARENDGLVGGTNGGSLYYYRARYYDPVLKQWLSEDPIGIRGGINLRAYVGGNPVSNTDPHGLQQFPIPSSGTSGVQQAGATAGRPMPQQSSPSNNICTLSPDLYPEACRRHDECYSNPCKSQSECDADFFRDMLVEGAPYTFILPFAFVPVTYYLGVTTFGGPYYRDAQSSGTRP